MKLSIFRNMDVAWFNNPARIEMEDFLVKLEYQIHSEYMMYPDDITDDEVIINYGIYRATLDVVGFLKYYCTKEKTKRNVLCRSTASKPVTVRRLMDEVKTTVRMLSKWIPTKSTNLSTRNHMRLILLQNIGVKDNG